MLSVGSSHWLQGMSKCMPSPFPKCQYHPKEKQAPQNDRNSSLTGHGGEDMEAAISPSFPSQDTRGNTLPTASMPSPPQNQDIQLPWSCSGSLSSSLVVHCWSSVHWKALCRPARPSVPLPRVSSIRLAIGVNISHWAQNN